MRAGIRVASLQLRAASRLRSASVARRVPSLARAPHPARAMASSPQRGALGAAPTPSPVVLGASAAAPGSPRSVAVAAATAEASPANPLLSDDLFPRFSEVKAEDVVPGMRALLKELEADIAKLEASVAPTWPGLVEPLERISDKLGRPWGVVSHLKAVRDSEPLRKAVEEVQPEKVALTMKLAQSEPVYQAFKALREGPAWSGLSEAQRRVVEGELRDATLSGVGLSGDAKARFNAIQQELSKLATDFSNNVLDATKKFTRIITDASHVAGLPPSALALAAQTAVSKGHAGATPEAGPWAITLDAPSYMAVMAHAAHRPLREEVYRAFITRASEPESDNTPLIEKTLALKRERAQLLGFDHHAAVSMASKMATLERAEALLEELRVASFEAAKRDLEEVRAFAVAKGAAEADELRQWDVGFWAERLREERYGLKEEELRPYFPLPAVLDGLFDLAHRLFGVRVEAADGQAPVWHKDVRFFSIKDEHDKPLAFFYLDPYSRPAEKRGGAWMDEVAGRSRLLAPKGSAVRLPVAHMVCNSAEPVGDKPATLTFREVETLAHELGHALQHMLTRCEEGLVAGIRGVEWDAVELPSQFMENWCYHRPTLNKMSKHVDTGASLPDDLYAKLVAAKNYRAGSQMLRQVHFSSVDLELHSRYVPGADGGVFAVDRRMAERTSVMTPLPEDRFLCSFSHIFAGGYSAGYFSYKWAEVLSADAFAAFEDAGLDDEKAVAATGRRFRETVLALGGGRAPLDVFVDFRGREPSTAALLRHSGLVKAH